MLSNLNEIATRISDIRSKSLILEAIRCYEIGSFRAATVLCWSVACFDLIEKLRELEQSGDAKAKQIARRLDSLQTRYQKGDESVLTALLEFERNLSSVFSKEFEFFGHNEFLDIERVREDRNRCAHPSYDAIGEHYSPTSELCRTHIRNVIELILLQPAKFGRAASDRVIKALQSKYFPEDRAEQKLYLAATDLISSKPSLVRAVVDKTFLPFLKKNHFCTRSTKLRYSLQF